MKTSSVTELVSNKKIFKIVQSFFLELVWEKINSVYVRLQFGSMRTDYFAHP